MNPTLRAEGLRTRIDKALGVADRPIVHGDRVATQPDRGPPAVLVQRLLRCIDPEGRFKPTRLRSSAAGAGRANPATAALPL
jgi:hypothetical protein